MTATAAVACGVGFGAGRSAQASRPAPAASSPPRSESPRAEQPIAPAIQAAPQPAPPPAPPEPAPAPAPSAAPANGSILAETPPEAIPALLASTLDAEVVDRAWATPTSVEMRDSVRLPGVELRDVSCRSSLCRVELRTASDGPPPRALFDAMCIGPDSKWAKLHVGCYLAPSEVRPNGSRDVVLYAFRDGRIP